LKWHIGEIPSLQCSKTCFPKLHLDAARTDFQIFFPQLNATKQVNALSFEMWCMLAAERWGTLTRRAMEKSDKMEWWMLVSTT
jgi:hypothetical protein